MKKVLLFTSMLIVSTLFTAKAQVSQAEFDALVALYNATDGDNWTDNTNWNITTGTKDDVTSNWYGLNVEGGHITQIMLYNNNLTGTIPTEIGNLTSLTKLYLNGNNLSGSIPSSISNLSNLTDLTLNSNQLSGNIPLGIWNMTNLNYLRLYNNQLTGTIPSSIGNLSNILHLYLSSNQLTGTIPPETGNLSTLTILSFASNQLTGSIPSSIGNLSNATVINLSDNLLTGNIPSSIGNLSNIRSFILLKNQLTGSIPNEIGNLVLATTILLYNNQLTGNIPSTIGNLTRLDKIDLKNNQLSGNIPTEIGNLTRLKSMSLSNNQLVGNIPAEIANCSALETLNVQGNNLTGSIPIELGNLTSLKYLTLSNNLLSGAIPEEICNMTSLKYFYLQDNQLEGEVPNQFINHPSISTILIQNNHITSIPDFNGSSLTQLNIKNNRLTFGDIETNISKTNNNYYPQAKIGSKQYLYAAIGSNKTISIVTDGSNNTYQWYKDDVAISGATNFSYTITNFELADEGTYYCIVKNTVATLLDLQTEDIVVSSSASPIIISQPENLANQCGDANISFSVETCYGESYKWQKKTDGSSWTDVTDAAIWDGYNTETLSFVSNNHQVIDNTSYRCIVSNPNGSEISNTASLFFETENPLLEVQAFILEIDETGSGILKPSDLVVSASDNCSISDTILSKANFDCSNIGTPTTIDITLSDISGNGTTKQAIITVVDNMDPSLSVENFTLELDQTGSATLDAANVITDASDNCSIADTTLSQTTFNCSNIGTPTTIDVTISDESGNSVSKQISITVVDNLDPVLNIQNQTLQLNADGNATLTSNDVITEASDNCSISDTTLSQTAFDCTYIGLPTPVTVTVIDGSGNESSKQAIITVEDNVAPVLNVQNHTLYLDADGNATLSPNDVITEASDNCSISDTTLSQTAFDCTNIGIPTPIIVTVIDGSGNESSKQAIITVEDNVAPVLNVQNHTLYLGADGNTSLSPNDVITEASDNCSLADTILSQADFDCSDVGTPVSVDVTLTDLSGNSTVETVAITISDTIKPLLSVQNKTIYVDENGSAILVAGEVVTEASDNCSIQDTTLSKYNFDCSNIGSAVNVDITITDASGNSMVKTILVTTLDTIKPDIPILANIEEECSATLIEPTTTDNCTGTITATTNDPLTYTTQGTYTVTWTFNDEYGNSVDAEQIVIIDDITNPTISCHTDTSIAINIGNTTYLVDGTELDPTMNDDNCSVATIFNDFNNSASLQDAELPLGTTTIFWSISDEAGNETTCSHNVTITDAVGTGDNSKNNSFGIFPNPAKTYIRIYSNYGEHIEAIIILDCTGKLLMTKNINNLNDVIDISSLQPGMYYIYLKGEHLVETFKLTVVN